MSKLGNHQNPGCWLVHLFRIWERSKTDPSPNRRFRRWLFPLSMNKNLRFFHVKAWKSSKSWIIFKNKFRKKFLKPRRLAVSGGVSFWPLPYQKRHVSKKSIVFLISQTKLMKFKGLKRCQNYRSIKIDSKSQHKIHIKTWKTSKSWVLASTSVFDMGEVKNWPLPKAGV